MIDTNKYNLGQFLSVRPMESTRSGNPVANQVVAVFEYGEIFQSYDTIIAIRRGQDVWLDPAWNYSKTTQKYLSQFLNGDKKKDIEAALKEGYYHFLS